MTDSNTTDYYNEIHRRNNILAKNGIHATHFKGYFAKEVTKSGTEIFVSCMDENHIDEIKPKLREFLDSHCEYDDGSEAA